MIHSPCGHVNPRSPCMDPNNLAAGCSKKFPKAFRDSTAMGNDSYPLYKRPEHYPGGDRFLMKNVTVG